jgi:predicted enzyme related to lactoylglutathione lyase
MDYRHISCSDGAHAGGVIRLTDEMRQHGARPVWLGYIGVEDVDATVAAIEADGGKVLKPAWDIPSVGRLALVSDPQGAPFYVMRGASDENSNAFSVDQRQHVQWNELSTVDADAAIGFYSRHFGWAQEGGMDMGEMGQYRFIQNDGVTIGAVMPKMPEMPVSVWSFYVGVDDIDRAVRAIGQGGGQILNGPMEIPGGDYAVNAMDPEGAAFGLVGPRNS